MLGGERGAEGSGGRCGQRLERVWLHTVNPGPGTTQAACGDKGYRGLGGGADGGHSITAHFVRAGGYGITSREPTRFSGNDVGPPEHMD